jgi:integrase/recombinase XerD
MQTTKTFSILFWIHSSRAKEDLTKVYVRITVNGKRANVSLKCMADIRYWDSKKQRAKGTNKQSKNLNSYLDQAHSQLIQIYQELRFKNELITADLIKAKFLGEDSNSKSLQEILAYHNQKIENTHASGSIRNFAVTEKYINKYLNQKLKTSDIFLNKLNYKFISDFENFLMRCYPKGHPRAMSHNTVMKHIQRLRKIVTLAYHLEWIDKDPFIRWKTTFEKTNREFLSANELSNLETYNLRLDRLDRVRDLFIFSCYTGISYTDIVKLTKANISIGIDGGKWIVTKRQKTKTPIRIPILPKAQEILDKYENHPITEITGTLLPVISNAKLNLYLKEVADAAGITKNLTFHMARHTFATTVTLSNGVPIETVSKLLGHTEIATTQVYAKVLENKISSDISDLKKKLSIQNKRLTK